MNHLSNHMRYMTRLQPHQKGYILVRISCFGSLRLGHTRVTHSYLLLGEEQPHCVGCDAPLTVRHFLLECGDFAQPRNSNFHVNNMKQLVQDIHIDKKKTKRTSELDKTAFRNLLKDGCRNLLKDGCRNLLKDGCKC